MNPLILTCLLCFVVCSVLGAQGSDATFSSELNVVTGGPASGEGLQNLLSDDDELETDEELSGGAHEHVSIHDINYAKDERKKRKSKGKRRNRHKNKSTTAFNPEHTFFTSGYTSTFSTTEDPCTSTHLGYCIHGYCKQIEGLEEPVCICMKGYDGERCGIQTLETKFKTRPDQSNNTELVQMVLVIIAVVLSVISCIAILLMTCAHYRSHKNFLASYLGSGAEQEKLQKPVGDLVV